MLSCSYQYVACYFSQFCHRDCAHCLLQPLKFALSCQTFLLCHMNWNSMLTLRPFLSFTYCFKPNDPACHYTLPCKKVWILQIQSAIFLETACFVGLKLLHLLLSAIHSVCMAVTCVIVYAMKCHFQWSLRHQNTLSVHIHRNWGLLASLWLVRKKHANLCLAQCCLTSHIIVARSHFCIKGLLQKPVYIGCGFILSL